MLAPAVYPAWLGLQASGDFAQVVAWAFAGFSYLTAIVVGVPVFLLFRAQGLISWWHYVLGAALIALIPGFLAATGGDPEDALRIVGQITAIGAVSGLVFWIIGIWGSTPNTDAHD